MSSSEHLSGWNYEFNLANPQPPTADSIKWIWEETAVYALSETDYLLRNKRTEAQAIIRFDVLQALSLCRTFRTLAEHVQVIGQQIPALANQPHDVYQVLQHLSQQGLLRAASELLTQWQAPFPSAHLPLVSIAIRTSDRPMLLERLIHSLEANEQRFGSHYRYTVIDDSKDAHNQQRNADLIKNAVLDIHHYDQIQQRTAIEQFAKATATDRTTLDWLLAPRKTPSYGRAWNHALLLYAGQRFLLLDDDALMQAYHPVANRSSAELTILEISSRSDEAHFFHHPNQLVEQAREAFCDPIAEHATWLGKPLAERLTQYQSGFPNSIDLRYLTAEQINSIRPESNILITTNGVLGDPGTSQLYWLFDLDAASRARLTASASDYQYALQKRCLWRGLPTAQIASERTLIATTLTGLDNRLLMPPTLPEGRSEDAFFGSLLKCVYPNALYGHLPLSLGHWPEPERSWELADLQTALMPQLPHFLREFALQQRTRCLSAAAAQRFTFYAMLFDDLAQGSESIVRDAIADYVLYIRSDWLRRLQQQLRTFANAPDYWRHDVERLLATNAQSLALDDIDFDGWINTVRNIAHRYAAVLHAWPTIWNYCRAHPIINTH